MIKISAEALKDFQTCSLLYEYRHSPSKIPEYVDIRDRRAKKFDVTIKRVAAFFFWKKQSLTEPSYTALQNRWTRLWFDKDTKAADIATMSTEVAWGNDVSYTSQAAASLLAFYEDFAANPEQEVVLLDEPFIVPLDKGLALEGTFDVVLRHKKPNGEYRYDVYKWVAFNVKRAVHFWMFDLVMLDYAFKYRNNNEPIDVHYHLWNFGTHNPGRKEVVIERRDFQLLDHWAHELANTKVFAPRRGLTAYCKSCPFDLPCSKWQPPVLENIPTGKKIPALIKERK